MVASTDRLCMKETKLTLLYSQEALFRDIVGGGGGRTRLIVQFISDVQSLQLIVEKCDQNNLLLKNHSFTFISAVTYYTWPKKRNDNSGTYRTIITENCMSHQMAYKSLQGLVYCSTTFN